MPGAFDFIDITSLKLIYFSPTGTTRKVIEAIANGVQITAFEHVDLTPPGAVTCASGSVDHSLTISISFDKVEAGICSNGLLQKSSRTLYRPGSNPAGSVA